MGAGPVSDSFDLFLGPVSSYLVALINLHVRRCVYFYCMFDLHDWLIILGCLSFSEGKQRKSGCGREGRREGKELGRMQGEETEVRM